MFLPMPVNSLKSHRSLHPSEMSRDRNKRDVVKDSGVKSNGSEVRRTKARLGDTREVDG